MKSIRHYMTRVLPLLLGTALLFASCSKKGNEGDVIPKEALFVANINVASLWQKGDLAHAGNLQMVQSLRQQLGALAPEADRMVEAFLADPSSCGLALERDITCFTVSNDGHFPVVVSAWMKDKKNFDSFLEQLDNATGLGIEKMKKHGLDITRLDNSLIVASNGERVLFVCDERSGSETLSDYASTLFNLKKEASMSSVDNFANYLTLNKDFGIFLPYENLMNLGGALAMSQISSLIPQQDMDQLKKAAIYILGNFEKGSIDITSGYYDMPKDLMAISDTRFNKEILDYMPEQGLIAFTCALNTSALVDYLGKNKDFDVNTEVGLDDLTIADLIEAFDGSIALSFYGMQDGKPLITLALDIDDSEAISDLIDAIGLVERCEHVYVSNEVPMLQVFLDDDVAVLSTDATLIANIAKGEKTQGLKALGTKAREGNYFYMNLNLEQYPADIVNLIGTNDMATFFLSLFDHIECLPNNRTEGLTHIYMADHETNSLAYILRSFDKLN